MPRIPALLAAALLAAGCAGGIFSGAGPAERAGVLLDLHDRESFRHEPDRESTRERCLEEIRFLAGAEYDTWREASFAAWVLLRVAQADPTVVGRNEAVHALESVGRLFADAEEPAEPGEPVEFTRAFQRLQELHEGKDGRHATDEAAAECASLLEAVGALRIPIPEDGNATILGARRKALRDALGIVVAADRHGESHAGEEIRALCDRTMIRLGAQAVRATLVESALHDPDDRVRFSAAGILGSFPGEGLAKPLVAAYAKERSTSVRRVIVQSLGLRAAAGPGTDREAAVPILIRALDDDFRGVRFHGREALRHISGEDLGERPGPWAEWWSAQAAPR